MKNVEKNAKGPEFDLYDRICVELRKIGVPAHLRGYAYLAEAVVLTVQQPETIHHMTAGLYPSVARKYHTTPGGAERAMRHAIEVAWTRGRLDTVNQMYGYKVFAKEDKPTNGEFIARMANVVKQRMREAA